MSVQFLTIDPEQAQQRIDNFLLRRLKGVPKSHIYRILRKGEVRVNKKRIKASYKLQAGDYVRIPPIKVAAPAQPMVLNKSFLDDFAQHILYEDKGLLVLNKPSGLAVHGGSGVKLGVIEVVRQLRPDCKNLELVHRLDRETSGCLLIAKKRSVLRELHELLREKQVVKHYLALVKGRVRKKIIVDAPLQKSILRSGERIVVVDPAGKASVTTFEPLCHHDGYTLVKATPETGRTHQIRVHAAHAGYPIAGDEKYGDVDFNKKLRHQGCKRLFLHAESLTFKLSSTEENFNIEAPLQSALQKFLPFSG